MTDRERAEQSSAEFRLDSRRTQRWIRTAPTERWWPGAWLPLLGLLFLALLAFFYVAPSSVEPAVRAESEAALHAAGYTALTVQADGQELLVRGAVVGGLSPSQESRVKAVAGATHCPSVIGDLACPTVVAVQVKALPRPTPAPAPMAKAEPPAAAIPAARGHDFVFTADHERLVLRGEVPDDQTRAAIVAEAKKTKFADVVVDELTVSSETARTEYPLAYSRALGVLDELVSGVATWKAGELSVRGLVAKDDEASARTRFNAVDRSPGVGEIDLMVSEVLDTCDKDFADTLATPIRFATGKAAIKRQSQKIVEKLAEVAKRCPGTLAVQGHTDNVGNAASNRTLSQARADTVAAALSEHGVEPARLHAKGFGQDSPTTTNDTAVGRATNRRIEIRIERTLNKENER